MGALKLTYKENYRPLKVVRGNFYLQKNSDAARYAFGFNGQLKDNEIYGEGNAYTAEFWEYDPRSIRRWNVDPKPNIFLSPYNCFAGNPIYLLDKKGDIIDPWWLKNSKGKPKNFTSESDLSRFNQVAIDLYNTNKIFRNVVSMLHKSKDHYTVKQKNVISLSGAYAWYVQDEKTAYMSYFFPNNTAVFEETIHAGQDEFYSTKGIKRLHIEDEVEAKALNILNNFEDPSINTTNDYSPITNYLKTGIKNKEFDKTLDIFIEDIFDDYSMMMGGNWAKENNPKNINKETLFEFSKKVVPQQTIRQDEK